MADADAAPEVSEKEKEAAQVEEKDQVGVAGCSSICLSVI